MSRSSSVVAAFPFSNIYFKGQEIQPRQILKHQDMCFSTAAARTAAGIRLFHIPFATNHCISFVSKLVPGQEERPTKKGKRRELRR